MDIYSDDFKNSDVYKLIKDNEYDIKKELRVEKESVKNHESFIQCRGTYNYIKGLVKDLIKDEKIYVYHCTKLTKEEISTLETLKPLSLCNQYKNVIKILRKESDLEDDIIKQFESINYENVDKSAIFREGQVWFVLDQEVIDEGCEGFFRYYGGEAVRRCYLNSEEKYLKYLEKIGIPIIIKCYIPIKYIRNCDIASGLLDFVLGEEDFLNCEGYVKRSIRKEEIIEVIYK